MSHDSFCKRLSDVLSKQCELNGLEVLKLDWNPDYVGAGIRTFRLKMTKVAKVKCGLRTAQLAAAWQPGVVLGQTGRQRTKQSVSVVICVDGAGLVLSDLEKFKV